MARLFKVTVGWLFYYLPTSGIGIVVIFSFPFRYFYCFAFLHLNLIFRIDYPNFGSYFDQRIFKGILYEQIPKERK